MAFTLEPLRALTLQFMAWSNQAKKHGEWPPLLNLWWPRRSWLTWDALFLSDLVDFTSPRLLVIVAYTGYSDIDAGLRARLLMQGWRSD